MGLRHHLTDVEKGQIDVLHCNGMSCREIGQRIQRGKRSVAAYLKRRRSPPKANGRGGQYILSERGRRALLRVATQGRLTARQVRDKANAPVSVRTVQRILQRDTNLVFGPLLPRPKLE